MEMSEFEEFEYQTYEEFMEGKKEHRPKPLKSLGPKKCSKALWNKAVLAHKVTGNFESNQRLWLIFFKAQRFNLSSFKHYQGKIDRGFL